MREGRVSEYYARTLNLIPLCILTTGTPTLLHCLLRARASWLAEGSLPRVLYPQCFLLWS